MITKEVQDIIDRLLLNNWYEKVGLRETHDIVFGVVHRIVWIV